MSIAKQRTPLDSGFTVETSYRVEQIATDHALSTADVHTIYAEVGMPPVDDETAARAANTANTLAARRILADPTVESRLAAEAVCRAVLADGRPVEEYVVAPIGPGVCTHSTRTVVGYVLRETIDANGRMLTRRGEYAARRGTPVGYDIGVFVDPVQGFDMAHARAGEYRGRGRTVLVDWLFACGHRS